MSKSAEYLKEYYYQKGKADDYEKYAGQIQDYKNNLLNDCDDEIADINSKIDSLQQELSSAIRHNATFDSHTADLDNEKEHDPASGASGLSGAVSDLESEHTDLINKKNNAESAASTAYSNYKNALEQEKQDLIDAGKKLLGL